MKRPDMLDYPDELPQVDGVDCTACEYGVYGDASCAAGREVTKPGEQGCSQGKEMDPDDAA